MTYKWTTCDTNESITIGEAGLSKPVYLLQPNGAAPTAELSYDGLCSVGSTNPYAWLVDANAEHLGLNLEGVDSQAKMWLGCDFHDGFILRDTVTGDYWLEELTTMLMDGVSMTGLFTQAIGADFNIFDVEEELPGHDKTAEELILSGRLKSICLSEIVKLKYQIKLSFNSGAKYEDYPASEPCPRPGYLYA